MATEKPFMTGEHWRQWIATLGPMIVTAIAVGLWVVTAINGVHDEVSKSQEQAERATSAVAQKVAVDEARLATLEHALDDLKRDVSASRTETSASLSQVLGSLSDLRVSIARDGKQK